MSYYEDWRFIQTGKWELSRLWDSYWESAGAVDFDECMRLLKAIETPLWGEWA